MKFIIFLFLGLGASIFDSSVILVVMPLFFSFMILDIFSNSFSNFFMFDGYSSCLMILSVWIFLFCFLSSFNENWSISSFPSFILFLNVIVILLAVCFSCLNMFLFYISFEFIFFIMFIFVLGWGYSPERFQASFYMVFYTLVVSLPFFLFLLYFGDFSSKFVLFYFNMNFWWFFLFLVFLVKLPVFGVHLWLPKAHVEAPVSGSMILAGVLLKLGGYGFIRFSFFCNKFIMSLSGYMFSIGLMGSLISCYLCLRQFDLKSLVAYSSVCHMGLFMCGFFSLSKFGLSGGIFMLIGHGLCSSCLFYILFLLYEHFHSRSILIIKSNLFIIPYLGFWWFLSCVLNMGLPPSLGFFSEVFIILGSGSYSPLSFLFVFSVLFLSGVYSIYLFVSVYHGNISLMTNFSFSLNLRQSLVIAGHLLPVFMLTFCLSEFFW